MGEVEPQMGSVTEEQEGVWILRFGQKLRVYTPFRSSYNEDYSILGSRLFSPDP